MTIQQTLRGYDLFRPLSDDEILRISDRATLRSFKVGETIYRHDDRATHVMLVIEGAAHMMLPALSKDFRLLISRVGRGELFGIAPLLGGEIYTATAVAVEPTTTVAIEAPVLIDVLERNPAVGLLVTREVAKLYMTRYTEVMRSMQAMVSHIPLSR